MTKEEAENIRNTIRKKNISSDSKIKNGFESLYNEWKSCHISRIEDRLRNCAKIGKPSLEYSLHRMNHPNCKSRECIQASYGTEDLINYFKNLGFKCNFKPGTYLFGYTGIDYIIINIL